MFKIREFAEIAQVSMSALRYYDEIGIFKPIQVDASTGYRFYSIEQLVRLNRILALKDLGLELTQIVQLLDEEVTTQALRGMLCLRQAKLQQHIQAEQEQLARIEARLKYIETEGQKLTHEVVLKEIKSFIAITSYTRVAGFLPNDHYTRALLDILKQHGIRPAGHALYLYHETALEESAVEVEVVVPVEYSFTTIPTLNADWNERISLREIPGVACMASTIYHGSPHSLVEAYQALGSWIQGNGYTIAGAGRKICLRWSGELHTYLTEIQYPVE